MKFVKDEFEETIKFYLFYSMITVENIILVQATLNTLLFGCGRFFEYTVVKSTTTIGCAFYSCVIWKAGQRKLKIFGMAYISFRYAEGEIPISFLKRRLK